MVPKAERRWVLGFAFLVMLLTSLPYVLAYFSQGETWRFSGFVFGVEDGNSYLGKMLRGSAGDWLFRSPYSALPQRGVLIFVPYILLGKLVAPPGSHEQLVSLYHLFRFGAGLLAILATYDFVAIFCIEIWARRVGVVLAVLGGGLGWLLILVGQKTWFGTLPLEFYSPESFGFLGIFGIPHLALARALLLWTLVRYLKSAGSREKITPDQGVITGLLWLSASLAQPLAGMLIAFVIGLHLAAVAGWQAWRQRSGKSVDWPGWRVMLRSVLLIALIPAPYLLYNLIAFAWDPYLRAWTFQNQIPSPHPAHYLLAYMIVLPLIYMGSRRILRSNPWQGILLVAWVCSLPLLAYAPFSLQRRLPEGIWVAMVALAMVALESLHWGSRTRVVLVSGLLVTCTLSTLLLWSGSFQTVRQPGQPLFLPVDQIRVFEFLESSAGEGQTVLAAFQTGNALPAWTPQFVVIGHGPESIHLGDNLPRVKSFFDKNHPDQERLALISEFGVDYVLWGPPERALGGWYPAQTSILRRVFEKGDYAIFQIAASED